MACGCTNPVCKEVFVNPCSVGTNTGIKATETGTWTAVLEFNNAFKTFGVSVTDGEAISILTELLNENYAHEFRLYDTNDDLVDCYILNTRLNYNVADAPAPAPAADTWEWGSVTVGSLANTVTDDLFAGDVSPIIWLNGNPVDWDANGITKNDDELDFTAIGGVSGIIRFQYKNLP